MIKSGQLTLNQISFVLGPTELFAVSSDAANISKLFPQIHPLLLFWIFGYSKQRWLQLTQISVDCSHGRDRAVQHLCFAVCNLSARQVDRATNNVTRKVPCAEHRVVLRVHGCNQAGQLGNNAHRIAQLIGIHVLQSFGHALGAWITSVKEHVTVFAVNAHREDVRRVTQSWINPVTDEACSLINHRSAWLCKDSISLLDGQAKPLHLIFELLLVADGIWVNHFPKVWIGVLDCQRIQSTANLGLLAADDSCLTLESNVVNNVHHGLV